MRLEVTVDEKLYWIEVKDHWTQRDRQAWLNAGRYSEGDFKNAETQEAATSRIETNRLAMLRQWSAACYLADVDGVEFRNVADITPEALANFDASLYRLMTMAPLDAWEARSKLGEPNGRRL